MSFFVYDLDFQVAPWAQGRPGLPGPRPGNAHASQYIIPTVTTLTPKDYSHIHMLASRMEDLNKLEEWQDTIKPNIVNSQTKHISNFLRQSPR